MRAQSVPTIYWYLPQKTEVTVQLQAHQKALFDAGFHLQIITAAPEFYQAVTNTSAALLGSTLFMVSAHGNETLAVISRLRALNTPLPIVVELPEFDESNVLQLLYCGADQYCLQNTSTDLWIALLSSLLRRSGQTELVLPEVAKAPVVEPLTESLWSLIDEGWMLICPEGGQLDLTTTERQLLQTMCLQPDKRASHQQLLEAISNGDESEDPVVAHNRLGVVISRLKRKAQGENMTLPIRSVYKWGYMFGAAIQVL